MFAYIRARERDCGDNVVDLKDCFSIVNGNKNAFFSKGVLS